jgi:signal peptidase I
VNSGTPDMDNQKDNSTSMNNRTGLAITSLLIGIISIPTLGILILGAILGIVLGVIALKRVKSNPAQYGGKNLAVVGIALNTLSLLLSVIIAPFVVIFIVQPVKVEGSAMKPTLNNGDRIFVWKQVGDIERGDIVVFWYPEDPSKSFIMRVIGLPGETIRMDQRGQLFINGRAVEEPFLAPERNMSPRVIPETYVKPHYYFVMGDNRDASNDSRSWGLVPEKYIYGEFAGRYISGD